jgi:hypothetical protein
MLRDGVGERVLDYCKLIDSNDLDAAKKYLSLWVGHDVTKKRNLIFTLQYFKRSKQVISITKMLLEEI